MAVPDKEIILIPLLIWSMAVLVFHGYSRLVLGSLKTRNMVSDLNIHYMQRSGGSVVDRTLDYQTQVHSLTICRWLYVSFHARPVT